MIRASALLISLGLMGCGISQAAARGGSDSPLEGVDFLLSVVVCRLVDTSGLMMGLGTH
jgi:hypothetical protein